MAGKVLNEHSIGEVIDFKKFAAFTRNKNELKIWTILFFIKKSLVRQIQICFKFSF